MSLRRLLLLLLIEQRTVVVASELSLKLADAHLEHPVLFSDDTRLCQSCGKRKGGNLLRTQRGCARTTAS